MDPVSVLSGKCQLRVQDITSNYFQVAPCACCVKFCGREPEGCDGRDILCEVASGHCRGAYASGYAPSHRDLGGLYGFLYFLLALVWVSTFVIVHLVALDDERKYLAKLYLFRRTTEQRNRKAERWAIVMGLVLGIVSIAPFMLSAKLARMRAQEEFRRRNENLMGKGVVGAYMELLWPKPEKTPLYQASDFSTRLHPSSPVNPKMGSPRSRSPMSRSPSSSPGRTRRLVVPITDEIRELSFRAEQSNDFVPGTPHHAFDLNENHADTHKHSPRRTVFGNWWNHLFGTNTKSDAASQLRPESLAHSTAAEHMPLPQRFAAMFNRILRKGGHESLDAQDSPQRIVHRVANEAGESSPQRLLIARTRSPVKNFQRQLHFPSSPFQFRDSPRASDALVTHIEVDDTNLSRPAQVQRTLNFSRQPSINSEKKTSNPPMESAKKVPKSSDVQGVQVAVVEDDGYDLL